MLYSALWASRVSNIFLTALGITPASDGSVPFYTNTSEVTTDSKKAGH
jgi:hypothetical protein